MSACNCMYGPGDPRCCAYRDYQPSFAPPWPYHPPSVPPQRGWECPKCGGVNAPWMPTCMTCQPTPPATEPSTNQGASE